MRRDKKAQMQQVFVFILAALIFGMILIYGYKAINDFIDRSREVSLLELRTELVASINKMTSGSDVRKATFNLPPTVDYVCFLDLDKNRIPLEERHKQALCTEGSEYYFPLICDAWVDNVDQNIYFYPMTDLTLTSKPIEVNQYPLPDKGEAKGFLCIETKKDRITIMLEGKGDRTLIEESTEE